MKLFFSLSGAILHRWLIKPEWPAGPKVRSECFIYDPTSQYPHTRAVEPSQFGNHPVWVVIVRRVVAPLLTAANMAGKDVYLM